MKRRTSITLIAALLSSTVFLSAEAFAQQSTTGSFVTGVGDVGCGVGYYK
jgi:hypothetical protein